MSEKTRIKNNEIKQENVLLSRQRVQSSEDEHQLEFVDEVNGIAYINDAKSIRLNATRNSLEKIETSVVLIIGGEDHDNDYSLLSQLVKQKVVAIIYLGNYSDEILKHYSAHYMLFSKASSMHEAVQVASCYGKSGDAVLFSPACSNGVDNYKIKGKEFKACVESLSGK
ncbi:MAG: hypothetical protein H0W84_10575 [Bacteroidetes bacterium]|nr:hypothetical protein [Bacteroidota bacterium]